MSRFFGQQEEDLSWIPEVQQDAQNIINEGRDVTLARIISQVGGNLHLKGAECYTDALIALAKKFSSVKDNPSLRKEWQFAHQRLNEEKTTYARIEIPSSDENRAFCGRVGALSPTGDFEIPGWLKAGGIIMILSVVGMIIYIKY